MNLVVVAVSPFAGVSFLLAAYPTGHCHASSAVSDALPSHAFVRLPGAFVDVLPRADAVARLVLSSFFALPSPFAVVPGIWHFPPVDGSTPLLPSVAAALVLPLLFFSACLVVPFLVPAAVSATRAALAVPLVALSATFVLVGDSATLVRVAIGSEPVCLLIPCGSLPFWLVVPLPIRSPFSFSDPPRTHGLLSTLAAVDVLIFVILLRHPKLPQVDKPMSPLWRCRHRCPTPIAPLRQLRSVALRNHGAAAAASVWAAHELAPPGRIKKSSGHGKAQSQPILTYYLLISAPKNDNP